MDASYSLHDDSVSMLSNLNMLNLDGLILEGIKPITNETIVNIVRNNPNLKQLNVSRSRIKDAGN